MQHSLTDQNPLREIFRKLWRRRVLIGSVLLIILVLTYIAISQIKPRYMASARILLTPRTTTGIVDARAYVDQMEQSYDSVNNQVEILLSRQLLGKLVDKKNLLENPYFNPPVAPSSFWSKLPLIGRDSDAESPLSNEQTAERRNLRRERLITSLSTNFQVLVRPKTKVISVSLETPGAQMSADLVNSLCDLYVVDQLEAKFEAAQKANAWLSERVVELREKANASDRAVETYRAANGLLGARNSTLVEQQITELTSQMTLARANRTAAEAKLRQGRDVARSTSGSGMTEFAQSGLIQKLREEESEVEKNIAQLSSEYGARHPKLVAANAQLQDTRRKLKLETDKVLGGIESETNMARAREQAVESQLEVLKKQLTSSNSAEVGLRALELEAKSNRALLENFLSRFKETSTVDTEGAQRADARIISRANTPEFPSFPKKRIMMGGAFLAGLLLAITIALLIEYLDRGFRSGLQFETLTGIPVLAMVPVVTADKNRPADFFLDKPGSSFAESLHSILAGLTLTSGADPNRTIVVTSSQPSEGKSTLCLCMARMMAASGRSTLLIEADLRRPSIHKQLGVERSIGLSEVLTGQAELESVLIHDTRTNAHILLAGKDTVNPSKLINSHQMQQLVDEARKHYDMVIIDTAPILAVADTTVLANRADGVIYCCRWAETSREVSMLGLKELMEARARLLGAVITLVDTRKVQSYGYADTSYYYYSRKYYSE